MGVILLGMGTWSVSGVPVHSYFLILVVVHECKRCINLLTCTNKLYEFFVIYVIIPNDKMQEKKNKSAK